MCTEKLNKKKEAIETDVLLERHLKEIEELEKRLAKEEKDAGH